MLRVGHLFLVLLEHAAELRLLPAVVQPADLLFAHVLLLLAKLFARDVLRVRLEIPLVVGPLVVVSSHGDVTSVEVRAASGLSLADSGAQWKPGCFNANVGDESDVTGASRALGRYYMSQSSAHDRPVRRALEVPPMIDPTYF